MNSLSPIESCGCPKGVEKSKRDEESRIYQFLIGLDDMYSTLRTNIINMDPFSNLGHVYAMVMQEESHRGITTSREATAAVGFYAHSDRSPPARAPSTATSVPGSPHPNRTPTGRPWCTFCSWVGHTQERCYRRLGIPPPSKDKGRGRQPTPTQNGTLTAPAHALAHAMIV